MSDGERAAIASTPDGPLPLAVEGEFPAWLEPELQRSLGDTLLAEMIAMGERAPVDLRINTLKAVREDMLHDLGAAGLAAAPTPYAPAGIRLARDEKLSALSRMEAFENGLFEFQDEAARRRAAVRGKTGGAHSRSCGGRRRQSACAGGCDAEPRRDRRVRHRRCPARAAGPRAERAGATIIASHVLVGAPPAGPFDAVFVDAPCSGTGTWRRQPEQRWRLTAEKLAALSHTQDLLLDQAAATMSRRVVYATCSLLACENEDRVAAFLDRHPSFCLAPAAEIWRAETGTPPPPGMAACFRATPRTTGTDGFFAAVLGADGLKVLFPACYRPVPAARVSAKALQINEFWRITGRDKIFLL